MDWFWQTAIIIGMFVLRLGVPLAITVAVAYWLRRLDKKWQAEAMLLWEESQVQRNYATLTLYERLEQPCWVAKGCNGHKRENCPACQHPDIPCWMARRGEDGRLPVECYDCERLLLKPKERALPI